jgi:impB/mucB/samB family/impB/mucB/samB family C-terminal domain
MRLLFLCWPHLPLRLECAARGMAAGIADTEPVVLGGLPWDPGTVLDMSPAASRLGVRRGQPLGEAHKLVPEALFLPAERGRYRERFEAALDALSRFTPSLEGETDPDSPTFGQAYLGVEGLERLWGGEEELLQKCLVAVAGEVGLPGEGRAGYGNTRFGARAAALVGRSVPVGDARVEADFLAPLPLRYLPADAETHGRLSRFGLRRIGEFAALPRSAVVARFGTAGGELHDLARGLDGRRLVPRRPIERLQAHAELDPPVETVEPLRFVLHHLCGALCEQLAARGRGAARARLVLELEGSPSRPLRPLIVQQALPEPVALADLVERLLLARLEADPPRLPVTRLSLELDGVAPAAAQQLGLFTPQTAQAARLDWQLAALAIRYGPDRLYRAELRDAGAALAEDRFGWLAAAPADVPGRA